MNGFSVLVILFSSQTLQKVFTTCIQDKNTQNDSFSPCCFSPSSLIFHPSFFSPPQSSVRNEVMATSHVTDEWMTLMEMSSLNCYIVRRYIATPSGVLRIYPGSLMDKAFDPTRRQWWGLLWWVWKEGQDDVKGVWSFGFGLRRVIQNSSAVCSC